MSALLDVVCVTRDDPHRVVRSLAGFAPIADRFLIAVDHRVPTELLAPYCTLTDEVFRFDPGRGADVVRNWLLERSTAEWALVVDGDEVVSQELLDVLPALLGADVAQHVVARRWCYPTIGTWLAEQPWWPDFQVRLLRRARWRPRVFGVLPHEGVRPVPPVAFHTAPLYHLDALLLSHAERVQKAAAYEAARPGLRSPGGDLLNATLFTPEDHGELGVRVTPDADLERLREVLVPVRRPATGPAPRVTPIDDRELDAWFPSLELPPTAYAARITPIDQELRLGPGEIWNLYVEVANLGTATLPGAAIGVPLVALSYRLCAADGRTLVDDGPRTPLPAPIAPGDVAIAPVRVDAPVERGSYLLHVDLVHDGVRWFETPVVVPIWVGERGGAKADAGPRPAA